MTYKIFFDDYKNKAIIKSEKILTHKDAKIRKESFVLELYAIYDKDRLYYLAYFQTLADALNELEKFSCGTFKEEAF